MNALLILIKDEEICLKHWKKVLSLLLEQELYVSPKKYEFLIIKIEFPGFIFWQRRTSGPNKVTELDIWSNPKHFN